MKGEMGSLTELFSLIRFEEIIPFVCMYKG
jgi:hypothetical protein